MSIIVVGSQYGAKTIWSYPTEGGAVPDWSYNTGSASVRAVVLDSDNNIYACGSKGTSSKNVWKLDSSGVLQESYEIGSVSTSLSDIAIDSNKNVFVAGTNNTDSPNVWKIAADFGSASGINSGFTNKRAYKVRVDDSDNIIVLVSYTDGGVPTTHIIKYNSALVEQWDNPGPTGWGRGYEMDLTSDGNVVVGFQSYSHAGLAFHYADGTVGGTEDFGAANINSLVVDSEDNIYFTNFYNPSGMGYGTFNSKYTYSEDTDSFSQVWENNIDAHLTGLVIYNYIKRSDDSVYIVAGEIGE